MSSHNEQETPDLRRGMRQPLVLSFRLYQRPGEGVCFRIDTSVHVSEVNKKGWSGKGGRTKVQNPNIAETVAAVTASNHDHNVSNEVRGMVPSRTRFFPMSLEELPLHLLHRHARVQGPDIIERLDAIAPSEYVQLVPVEHGRVRAPREGQGFRWVGLCPFAGDSVNDIERVVI